MQEKSSQVKNKFMLCAKCGGQIKYGRGWAHIVKTEKDYHFMCYYGETK